LTSTDPRGLATVALLKTRFDQGKDHLGLFEPFVEDALRNISSNNFISADICSVVEARSGLLIPTNTMQALLGRFAKSGFLSRQGGRFLRTTKPFKGPPIDERLAHLLAEQAQLGEALRQFAADHGIELTAPQALVTLGTFIAENKVSLVLQEAVSREQQHTGGVLPRKLARVIARFVSQRCLASPDLAQALEALVEGMVLRDALLLSDLADLGARFQKLTVAIDTPVLLAALDLAGIANGITAREFIALLRHTGATTIAFSPTRSEIRGILGMYEDRLATAHGRLSLYRNEVTLHVLSAKLTPSDMRSLSALLDRRLTDLGVEVRETPTRVPDYTMNEKALAEALVLPRDPDPERPRIRHDVDCVAAVLTLRAGRTDNSLDRCVAVFCSSTTQVVRNVQKWYSDEGGSGIPPMVHLIALSNIAWLKKPASARGMKLHELSAYCAAILRPQKATWDKFVATLRKLREDGTLTDDEAVAIVASDLAEPVLSQLDDDYEPDSDTILDAIERVRRSYQEGAENAAAIAIAQARSDVLLAEGDAAATRGMAALLKEGVERRVNGVATVVAGVFYLGLLTVLFAAAVLSVPGAFDAVPSSVRVFARLLVLATGLFTVVSWRRGTSLNDYRSAAHVAVAGWVRLHVFGMRTSDFP